jgi:glycosyltransferase involved in cell wall biosynthesis
MSTYNAEKYIMEAVFSILNQTYKDFEFLIIDDCSNDKTAEILNLINDPRVKIFFNKNNKGLTYNLNYLISLAKGEYIARMDSDDISMHNRFEHQINILRKDDSIGIVSSNAIIFGTKNALHKCPRTDGEIKASLYFSNPLVHSSIMFRKSLNLRYDIKYKKAQDYDLWLRSISLTKFYNITKQLIKYRVHNEQISSARGKYTQEHYSTLAKLTFYDKLLLNNNYKNIINNLSINYKFKIEEEIATKLFFKKIILLNTEFRYYLKIQVLNFWVLNLRKFNRHSFKFVFLQNKLLFFLFIKKIMTIL